MSGIAKRAFTQHELSVATATGHIRLIDRHYRPHIRGYPIDDIDPTRASDRDDAVYAEKTPEGYVLQVTIADVAAHVPKDSPLDKAARQRAFTIYRPPARDPMFPFILSEDRFSLEHEQERLGVTVSIALGNRFQVRDITFTRTVIAPECQDYATASHRMIQQGDDMELLAHLARGIRETARPPIHTGGGRDTYIDKAGFLRQGDAGAMAASKLVQVMMIFANNEIAKFFARTQLPFLFRNHLPSPDNTARAEYQPYDMGHYSLRSEGLVGAYSHCTSPIRRYADLVNQRMMHYVMDVIEELAAECARYLPEHDHRDKRDMLPLLWEHAEPLMEHLFAVQQAGDSARPQAERQLKDTLAMIVQQVNPQAGNALYRKDDPIAQLLAVALHPVLPYTHAELAAMTPHLNVSQAQEMDEVTELNRRNLDKWNEKIQDDLASGHFDALSPAAFSGMLRRAAVTGRINQPLTQEVLHRIQSGSMDTVPDCYSILVLNKEYQNTYWRALKRAALNAIERDPMVINNLFEKGMKEGEIHSDTYVAESMLRDSSAEKALPLMSAAGIEQHIEAALVVTYMPELGGREYAPPHYSLGYSKKDTARHARFNFIRAMAFGELGPLDQTILPTPLYAELGNDSRRRADILHEMVRDMNLTIETMGPRQRLDGKLSFAYKVYGPGIEHPVIGFVVEPTEALAKEKSATRILRSLQFKRAYAMEHPVEIGFPSNPQHLIRELAERRGWELHIPDRTEIREIERGVFRAELHLRIEAETLTLRSEGRNKDNALQYAFEALRDTLRERGLLPKEAPTAPQAAASTWVTWSAASRDGLPH